MATIPMSYTVEISGDDWIQHPLITEWWGSRDCKHLIPYLKQKYDINMIESYWKPKTIDISSNWITVEFESEQDYILWQLYQ